MYRWIHIILLSLIYSVLGAQSFSNKGRFSVAFDRGCIPMRINITEHGMYGVVTRQYYFFEGSNITNNKTFTYYEAGIYRIVQVIGADDIGDKSDTLHIEALELRKPDAPLSKCSGLGLSIRSNDTYYDSIRVYFEGSDSITLEFNETATHTYSSDGLQMVGLKGFFDNADEVCTTYFEEVMPTSTFFAPSILSASIKETCKDIYSLYLLIDQFDSLVNYRVNLNQAGTTQVFEGFLNSSTLVFHDIPFSISNYCVNIEAYDPCTGTSKLSNNVCSTPSSLSLSPFESLYSSYDTSSIYLNFDQVSSGSFEVYRKFEGGNFEPRVTVAESFHDPINILSRKYFYKIDYRDKCGNILYSAETHPPLIVAEKIKPNQYMVTFMEAQNSISGISNSFYNIGNPSSFTSKAITAQQFDVRLNAKDGAPRQYLSGSINYGENIILRSNTVTLKYELTIYVPNAFTPNKDKLNDTLEFFGLPTENATINIYSKWGHRIHTSQDPTIGWDGTINGSDAPEETYLYEIIFETTDGKKMRQKGTFTLIRKN